MESKQLTLTLQDPGPLKAVAGSRDRPLRIGEMEIPCYVLDDGTRVLTRKGITRALGRAWMTRNDRGGELPAFLAPKSISPFLSKDLTEERKTTIPFVMPHGGRPALGFPAELLPDVCAAWVDAYDAGALRPAQYATADAARTIGRALQKVGVIALVDEATGYQEQRPRDDLASHLHRWVAEHARQWEKRFDDDFTRQFGRLYGVSPTPGAARPIWVGGMIKNLIYDRMAPGLGDELRDRVKRGADGYPAERYHQHLTDDVGHGELKAHIRQVTMLMKVAGDKEQFMKLMNLHLPKPQVDAGAAAA